MPCCLKHFLPCWMPSTFRVCRPVWYVWLPHLNWLVPSSCKLSQGYSGSGPCPCYASQLLVSGCHRLSLPLLLFLLGFSASSPVWEACFFWMPFWVYFCNFCSTWLLCWYAAEFEGALRASIGVVMLSLWLLGCFFCWLYCSCQVVKWSWFFG